MKSRRYHKKNLQDERMRDPKRINKILELIKKIWEKNPDLRLCQLIGNIGNCFPSGDLYHIEDDLLMKALKIYYLDESYYHKGKKNEKKN